MTDKERRKADAVAALEKAEECCEALLDDDLSNECCVILNQMIAKVALT